MPVPTALTFRGGRLLESLPRWPEHEFAESDYRHGSGTLRFVSVMTRDVSDVDVFVECQVPASIPLYRLVHFQLERPAREAADLP